MIFYSIRRVPYKVYLSMKWVELGSFVKPTLKSDRFLFFCLTKRADIVVEGVGLEIT